MKIIYGVPGCFKCEQLKQEYNNNGTKFEYRDARDYIAKFQKLGVMSMPYEEEEYEVEEQGEPK